MSTGTHRGSDFMQEEDADQIAKEVLRQLEQQRTVDVETHRKHHEFIDTLITNHMKSQERKEKWITIVGGWGIITMLTGFGLAVWQFVKDHVK